MKLLYLLLLLVAVQLVCAGGSDDDCDGGSKGSDSNSGEARGCAGKSKGSNSDSGEDGGCGGGKKSSESDEDSCEKKSCGGDPNAIEDPCGDPCPVTCANKDKPRKCPKICRPKGCRCKDGYVKDFKGKCIKPAKCPTCKDKNEFYDCGSACDRECATLGEPCKIINVKCTERCYCKDGFARDGSGKCIPVDKCPPKVCPTDPNAIIVSCPSPCPVTCKNKDDKGPRPCAQICIAKGCQCKQGFVLDFKGKCIKPEKCPTCKDKNEFYDCGSACDRECATLGEPCKIVNIKCNEKCYCKDGFARDKTGKCIPIDKCPPRQCPTDPNAIIVPCGDPCPVTCSNKDDKGPRPCPKICIKNGCKCKAGFVRLKKDGKCVKIEKCPKCALNEELVFDNCPLEKTCQTYFEGAPDCSPIPDFSGCRCKKEFVRGDKGECIEPKKCCTDPNAELKACPNPCPGGTCKNPEFSPCKRKCFPFGCQCKKGYVKKSDKDATCVSLKSCKKCSSEEGSDSKEKSSSNENSSSEEKSSEECDCPDKSKKCGKNQVYSKCGNNGCQNTCDAPKKSLTCKGKCVPGCICQDGYLKNSDGKCVKPKDCCTCDD